MYSMLQCLKYGHVIAGLILHVHHFPTKTQILLHFVYVGGVVKRIERGYSYQR